MRKIGSTYLRFRKCQPEKNQYIRHPSKHFRLGKCTARRQIDRAEYHIAGSGDINATELKVDNVNARISGSGSIRCYATENLTGGVSGSGNVAYKGNPQINFSKRGLQKL